MAATLKKRKTPTGREGQLAFTVWFDANDLRRLRALRTASGVPLATILRRSVAATLRRVDRDGIESALEMREPTAAAEGPALSADPLT